NLGGKPAPPEEEEQPKPAPAKGAPTGDWTIQLDPDKGAWSEPSKLEKTTPATPAAKGATGNPVGAVASSRPISSVQWEERPTGIGESKIEMDPTLMEPALSPLPSDDDDPVIDPPKPAMQIPPGAYAPVHYPSPTPPPGMYGQPPIRHPQLE